MAPDSGSVRSLCRRCDGVVGDGSGRWSEELPAEILQAPERPRRHRHAAPASALAVENGDDEGNAGPLAGEAADDLGPPPALAG